MKRLFTILAALLFLVTALPLYAAPCDGEVTPVTFRSGESETAKINKIRNALRDYATGGIKSPYYSETRNRYEICFQTGEYILLPVWVDRIAESDPTFDGSFSLVVSGGSQYDVYMNGLNLRRNNDLSIPNTFLQVLNNSARNAIVENVTLSNVQYGLAIEGIGVVEVINAAITGDADKSGICLMAYPDGGIIRESNITGCAMGAHISGIGVQIINSTIQGSNTCVYAKGSRARISDTEIHSCQDTGITVDVMATETEITGGVLHDAETCINIRGDRAIVKNNEIHSCRIEGIHIEANDILVGAENKEHYADEKNSVHNCVTAIRVGHGDRNRFGYNNIYSNKNAEETIGLSTNGISIAEGMNEGLARPAVIMGEDSGLPLRCTTDEDGIVTRRELVFDIPGAGEIEIYRSDREFKQGVALITSCAVAEDGICVLGDLTLGEELEPTECGIPRYFVTALFTSSSSTMYVDEPFEFNGILPWSSVPVAPIEMPTTGTLATGDDDGSLTGGGTIIIVEDQPVITNDQPIIVAEDGDIRNPRDENPPAEDSEERNNEGNSDNEDQAATDNRIAPASEGAGDGVSGTSTGFSTGSSGVGATCSLMVENNADQSIVPLLIIFALGILLINRKTA